MDESTYIPRVYTLTKITGRRRNDDREVVIKGLQLNRRVFNALVIGSIPSLLVAAVFAPLMGVYAIFLFAAALGAWMTLVMRQVNSGLRIPLYKSLNNRRRSRSQVGMFLQCGLEMTPEMFEDVQVLSGTVPLERGRTDLDDLDAAMGVQSIEQVDAPVTVRPTVSTPTRSTNADTFLEGLIDS